MAALEGQRRGWARWQVAAKGCSPSAPAARAGQVPAPHPPAGRTRGQGDVGTMSLPPTRELPPISPPIRILPAHQGGPVAPHVLAVPAETKPVVSIPCGLASARFGGCSPPQSHQLREGTPKHSLPHRGLPSRPARRQREGVRGCISMLGSLLRCCHWQAGGSLIHAETLRCSMAWYSTAWRGDAHLGALHGAGLRLQLRLARQGKPV